MSTDSPTTPVRDCQIGELAKALVEFQKNMPQIDLNREVSVKTKAGGTYSFKYATLSFIWDKIREPLASTGLAVAQSIEDQSLVTILMHTSGESIRSRTPLITTEPGAQALGSAITYARRYALTAMLGITAEDDDDANMASGNSAQFSADDDKPWFNGTKEKHLEVLGKCVEKHKQGKRAKEMRKLFKVNKANAAIMESKDEFTAHDFATPPASKAWDI